MKKPTTLSVLKEILKEVKAIHSILEVKPKVGEDNSTVPDKNYIGKEFFAITDDGKLKTSEIIAQMNKKFDVWSWYDMEQLDTDFPPPKVATTRHFKKTVEADEDLKNKSADDLEKEGVKGITLRERLIMELVYFEENGEHLDVQNATLCSGSRDSDGDVPCDVPCVLWSSDGRGVCVRWYRPSSSYPDLRARAVVS